MTNDMYNDPSNEPLEKLKSLPLYLDGSDGSMWASREMWDGISADRSRAERLFVRVSDLLSLFSASPIDTAPKPD